MNESPLSIVKSLFPSIIDCNILDIGCGEGSFAGQLADAGASVVGIDPNPKAIEKSKLLVPGGRFEVGCAESLPFADSSFDIVVFVNALHHVPGPVMEQAIIEASRVMRERGFLVVIEPLPSGNFFEALRLIEDETDVRLAAQMALKKVVSGGQLKEINSLRYVRREIFDSAARYIERVVAVDPSREAAVRRREADIVSVINGVALKLPDGRLAFDQPNKADVLARGDTEGMI